MAQTVITTDDVDGSANAETVTFSYDGSTYEIDLGKKNRAAFDKALKPWIDVARKTSGRTGSRSSGGSRRGRRSSGRSSTDLATIRAWANDNGHPVSDRGRIPSAVVEAYNAAQSSS